MMEFLQYISTIYFSESSKLILYYNSYDSILCILVASNFNPIFLKTIDFRSFFLSGHAAPTPIPTFKVIIKRLNVYLQFLKVLSRTYK